MDIISRFDPYKAHIPPNALHSVVNETEDELVWAAFWWDTTVPQKGKGNLAGEEDPEKCNIFNDR
jgi:hypothetical protein